MPSLDSSLLGLKVLKAMKPDIEWNKNLLTFSICSFPNKTYSIKFDEIVKVIGYDDKAEYFAEQGVTIRITNEGGSKMFLIISANRYYVNIDEVAKTISHMAPSLKPF